MEGTDASVKWKDSATKFRNVTKARKFEEMSAGFMNFMSKYS